MSLYEQIRLFAFKGLQKSYYWRHFILILWLPALMSCMMYYSMSSRGNFTSNGIALIVIWCLLTFIYPYARFVYECIVEFIMGNTVFITSIKVMLVWKFVIALLLFCFSMFIAPVGLVILFFYNKKQYQKALAETENNQPQ